MKTEQRTILTDGESMIPVHFRKSSLGNLAFIPELQPGIVHFCPMFVFFPYRTTVIKNGGTWKAIEVSKKYLDRREPFEAFEMKLMS